MKFFAFRAQDLDLFNETMKDFITFKFVKGSFIAGKEDTYEADKMKMRIFGIETVSLIQKILNAKSFEDGEYPDWHTKKFNQITEKELSKLDYCGINLISNDTEKILAGWSFFANRDILEKMGLQFKKFLDKIEE